VETAGGGAAVAALRGNHLNSTSGTDLVLAGNSTVVAAFEPSGNHLEGNCSTSGGGLRIINSYASNVVSFLQASCPGVLYTQLGFE